MNGLRPTNESRGMQALIATSSRIPQDTTTTLPTQETQGAARTAPHKEHAEQGTTSDVTTRKKGGYKKEKKFTR